MAELIPVGIVRAQRFIALHPIVQAGTPTPMMPTAPMLAVRAKVDSAVRAANLIGAQANELRRALAFLGYHGTMSGPLSRISLAEAADWTFHAHIRTARCDTQKQLSLLPKARDLWKQGEAIGVLSLTDDSVNFCRTDTRLFFCALFILAQPLDPAHLRWLCHPRLADAWRAGAVLDHELPDRLATVLRESRHQRAPLRAARVLSYIGGVGVSQLFWTVLGGDPGTTSATKEDPDKHEQGEATAIITRVRVLFHHCLMRSLRHGDSQAREYCGHLLRHDQELFGTAGDPLLPAELPLLLQDEQPEVRIEAGATLLRLNGHTQPMVGSAMLEILNHPNPAVRWDAAIVLARAGGRREIEPLLEAMKAGSYKQQRAAILYVGMLGDSRAIPALIHVLRHGWEDLRSKTVSSLGLIRDPLAAAALAQWLEEATDWGPTEWYAIDVLAQVGRDLAVNTCLRALSHPSNSVRCGAAEALGRLGSKHAVPALIRALHVEQEPGARQDAVLSHDLRAMSARSLAQLRAREACGPLLRAIESGLRDRKRYLWSLMLSLGEIDPTKMLDYLSEVLEDTSGRGHKSAIGAMALLGDRRAIALLHQYLLKGSIHRDWHQELARNALARLQAKRPNRKCT